MVDQINDGGPAFPHPALADERFKPRPGDEGMSLRDWFAGQALASYAGGLMEADAQWIEQYGARNAYRIADAMLSARGHP